MNNETLTLILLVAIAGFVIWQFVKIGIKLQEERKWREYIESKRKKENK